MTYNNPGPGHSFSGSNITHNNRGHPNRVGITADVPYCWHCGYETTLSLDKERGGLKCNRCGANQDKKHLAGQNQLRDYRI